MALQFAEISKSTVCIKQEKKRKKEHRNKRDHADQIFSSLERNNGFKFPVSKQVK